MPPKTRANSGSIEPEVLFPSVPKFVPSLQLPTVRSVIGVMRHLTAAKVAHDKAVREVSKLLYAKWFHDTVYCIPVNGIKRTLENVWMTFVRDVRGCQPGEAGRLSVIYFLVITVSHNMMFTYYMRN